MINEHNGNILENLPKDKTVVICHQVNCKGVMGAGLAKQIRNKYPSVYISYKNRCNEGNMLGKAQLCCVEKNTLVANLFAQDGYGTGKRQTDYEAFRSALKDLLSLCNKNDEIRIPYKIGCGLAGGDWNIVLNIISEEASIYDIHIYKL